LGWSTSWPRAVATSAANTCNGTVVISGASRVGVFGTGIRWSAYGSTARSPSSAMTIVRAPRARTSWMFDTILSCSTPRPAGEGTTQMTGVPSSISAIGPCLSSPAANPSACMYASSLSLSAPSSAPGYPTCRPMNRVAVPELAGQLHLARDAGPVLDRILRDQAGVVCGTARDDEHLVDVAQVLVGEPDLVEHDVAGLGQPAQQSVGDRARLLGDLL